jgi:vesicular inhibitory amino acid transporter
MDEGQEYKRLNATDDEKQICRYNEEYAGEIQNDSQVDIMLDEHVGTIKKGVSYIHSVINSTNVVVGIGFLSFPFAFKSAGWIGGFIILFLTLFSTCYTSKILARCLSKFQPELQSFSDMGRESFGKKMEWFIAFIFFLELFLACSAYIILCGDNLDKLFHNRLSRGEWMIVSAIIILPSTWLTNLTILSYLSAFGIIASVFLLFAVIYTGFSSNEIPGSITKPSPTILFDLKKFPVAIGLIMVKISLLILPF